MCKWGGARARSGAVSERRGGASGKWAGRAGGMGVASGKMGGASGKMGGANEEAGGDRPTVRPRPDAARRADPPAPTRPAVGELRHDDQLVVQRQRRHLQQLGTVAITARARREPRVGAAVQAEARPRAVVHSGAVALLPLSLCQRTAVRRAIFFDTRVDVNKIEIKY